MDGGWMGGWMNGCKSRCKDFLQQLIIKIKNPIESCFK
jgi:hypothetical protein